MGSQGVSFPTHRSNKYGAFSFFLFFFLKIRDTQSANSKRTLNSGFLVVVGAWSFKKLNNLYPFEFYTKT